MPKYISPLAMLRKCLDSQTQVQLARKMQVSPSYLCDVLSGRREPGPAILDKLGLERVVYYREKT